MGNTLIAFRDKLLGQEPPQVSGHLQPAKPGLDIDLPSAWRAEEQGVAAVGYDFPGTRRHPRIIGCPPQKSVGIEQQVHCCSKSSRASSGSASSNSSPTTSSPLALPGTPLRLLSRSDQTSHRPASLRVDDLLARIHPIQQPGEVGLSLVNVHDCSHPSWVHPSSISTKIAI